LAANDKITVDGKLGEPEWGGATSTGPFVDVGTGKANPASPVSGATKLLWDDKNLYVAFEVTDADAYVGFTDPKAQPDDFTAAGQPKLWTKDTVEMMVDPDPSGDNKDYYELQIGPQNKVFKSQFDTLQQPSGGPNGPFGHEDWNPKLKSAVALKKGPDGKITGYTVEVAIPWAGYAKAANHPPQAGDVWRVNFYAMKNNGGVAWSPILGQGNFHKATRFGRITWSVPGAAPVAAGDGGAPPAGGGVGGAAGDGGVGRGRLGRGRRRVGAIPARRFASHGAPQPTRRDDPPRDPARAVAGGRPPGERSSLRPPKFGHARAHALPLENAQSLGRRLFGVRRRRARDPSGDRPRPGAAGQGQGGA